MDLIGHLDEKSIKQIAIEGNSDDPLEEAVAILKNDYTLIHAGNWGDPKMETWLKEKDDWLYISSMYLQHVNKDTKHPICKRFVNLGAFKELAPFFGIEPFHIYEKENRAKFGNVLATFAKIPLIIENDQVTQCNLSVTTSVTNKIYRIYKNKIENNNKSYTVTPIIHTSIANSQLHVCTSNKCNSVTYIDKKVTLVFFYRQKSVTFSLSSTKNAKMWLHLPNFPQNFHYSTIILTRNLILKTSTIPLFLTPTLRPPTIVPTYSTPTPKNYKLQDLISNILLYFKKAKGGLVLGAVEGHWDYFYSMLPQFKPADIDHAMLQLQTWGDIYEPKPGVWKRTAGVEEE